MDISFMHLCVEHEERNCNECSHLEDRPEAFIAFQIFEGSIINSKKTMAAAPFADAVKNMAIPQNFSGI